MSNQVFNPLMSDVTHNIRNRDCDIHNHDTMIHTDAMTLTHADAQDKPVMLSTLDNPFDPFTQFDSWFAFDSSKNYNSCSYLARIAKTSDELSETDNEFAIRQAIDEIVELNVLGNYKKVVKT